MYLNSTCESETILHHWIFSLLLVKSLCFSSLEMSSFILWWRPQPQSTCESGTFKEGQAEQLPSHCTRPLEHYVLDFGNEQLHIVMKPQPHPVRAAFKEGQAEQLPSHCTRPLEQQVNSSGLFILTKLVCIWFIPQTLMISVYFQIWTWTWEQQHHDSCCPPPPRLLHDGHRSGKFPHWDHDVKLFCEDQASSHYQLK